MTVKKMGPSLCTVTALISAQIQTTWISSSRLVLMANNKTMPCVLLDDWKP